MFGQRKGFQCKSCSFIVWYRAEGEFYLQPRCSQKNIYPSYVFGLPYVGVNEFDECDW